MMKPQNARGVPLKDEDLRVGKVLTTEWRVKADYAWDCGIAIARYFDGLKEGKIMATRCRKCRRTVVPPRVFCEWCFKPMDEWVEVRDTGRVNTFSVSFYSWDMTPLEKPEVPAIVEIDGCSPGVGFMHLLGEVGDNLEEILRRVKVGMKVRAVWKPADQRTGAITDILYFKPEEE